MKEWLKDWHEVVILGKKKEVKISFRGGNSSGNINSRSCLISGPPGIGKTSSV
jgi:DNA polymerase III delta prime subunit